MVGSAVPCLFQSCYDETDTLLSMDLLSSLTNVFLFVGPATKSSSISKLARVFIVCVEKHGCQTKSLLLLFDCLLFISAILTLSASLSNRLKLSFLPALPFPHWRSSSLSAAVGAEQEFKHCSLHQHMSCCFLEPSRNLIISSSSNTGDTGVTRSLFYFKKCPLYRWTGLVTEQF